MASDIDAGQLLYPKGAGGPREPRTRTAESLRRGHLRPARRRRAVRPCTSRVEQEAELGVERVRAIGDACVVST